MHGKARAGAGLNRDLRSTESESGAATSTNFVCGITNAFSASADAEPGCLPDNVSRCTPGRGVVFDGAPPEDADGRLVNGAATGRAVLLDLPRPTSTDD